MGISYEMTTFMSSYREVKFTNDTSCSKTFYRYSKFIKKEISKRQRKDKEMKKKAKYLIYGEKSIFDLCYVICL